MKRLSKILLSVLMISGLVSNTYAYSRDENSKVVKNVGQLIMNYALGLNTEKPLNKIKDISSDDYEIWNNVINYWDYIENDMVENIGGVPEGLPENNHVFIVLGYVLNDDGTMQDELIGRLQVALESAKKYPNSYILVTGGVEKNGWSEGQRMHDWLIENGLDEDRIIVEKEAQDTAGNAANSFEILYTQYPQITSCSIITSQYHLKRGSILYYAESLLKAKELGVEPIEFIGNGNAGWQREDKTEESLLIKAYSLSSIAHCTNAIVMNVLKIIVEILFVIVLLIIVIVKRRKKHKLG